MSNDAEKQFRAWASQNVHNIPGLSDRDDFEAEMARLREKAERDLADLIPAIEEQLGDLDDLMREVYEGVQDPALGFKDSSRD